MPITSQSECSAAAALLALSDTTASTDGHRLRRQDVVVAPLGHDNDENDCDANIQTEYFCASRATPEACKTNISIGMQCSYDCCGIGVCDANIQTEYFCASRATPEACRTDISIGMQCSYDCCGIGVNYHPPYCCETDLPLAHPPRPAPAALIPAKEVCVQATHTRKHASRRVPFAWAGPALCRPLF